MIDQILNDDDYAAALRRVEQIWSAESGSPDGEELDRLIHLIVTYEDKWWPILPPDPTDAIKRHEDQKMAGSSADDPPQRPMTGLFSLLTEDQKNIALEYRGEEGHGDDELQRGSPGNCS